MRINSRCCDPIFLSWSEFNFLSIYFLNSFGKIVAFELLPPIIIQDIINVVILTTIASALEYIYNYKKLS